ncbi:uncharacterized protein PHACADRAFT_256404 [Phanerochaete carnosa HHB-10118-sp]|uniref:Uncharacterized protein n=1 Tax=Phanerochaete carnosa (strain HHB-10118-sp) TaxID=650164 RepID=K5W9I9_PHACS|nr:uncharacterized protein PHACADRAFT_256404 [Phanerochaete carnosa HHB-10118-sp]EKM55639.1 hypothetical protein PHACADRAFT_256404 [Phanerochaete carnosa HHB-10118-sp]
MRATIPRLIRVVPRSKLATEYASASLVRPLPEPAPSVKQPILIEVLLKRKAEMGAKYPSNIRIEPVLTKKAYEGVPADTREELKELLKER